MNILVVNDDGYNAIGIKKLAKALKKYGNIYVCGPDTGRSASGHSIVIKKPISFDFVTEEKGIKWYKTSGMPADCVRLAVALLGVEFDVVFSGINNGLNIGTEIIYSGTVSAAREAQLEGIPNVALSTDFDCFDIVDKELDSLLEYIFVNKLYSKDYVLNVNFPNSRFKESIGYIACKQGVKNFRSRFDKCGDNIYQESVAHITYDTGKDTDVYLSNLGYITFVPLKVEQTDYEILRVLKDSIK